MESKHTKGEWKLDENPFGERIIYAIDSDGDKLAIAKTFHSWKENQANAKLIAAAPDLLVALEQIMYLSAHPEEINRIGNIAANAIKKATE